ncbi:nuclear transport factor 2 family protein [Zunongwangia sp. F260]|uniref:Nuclear transport factor 2 family protein n=1 Tax=Autumnicola lenta TaxID=3075593 RepID=A0ABU3CG78_9FLAO|nr:nuclear transport factor 2 family protein [Zunongwangia sp. F260]MDT0645363.1 nuclear transport factor 2 family protein [Zunongwangia sp. F260]
MKNFKNWMLLVSLIGFIACNQSGSSSSGDNKAEDVDSSTANETSASAETEVASAVEALNMAIIDPEESVLDTLISDKITYGHSSGLVQNKEEFIDDLVNGDFNFSSVDVSDQNIHIEDETAIVRHVFSAKATNAGDPVDVRIGNVLVYVKQGDHWKLLARQAFKL